MHLPCPHCMESTPSKPSSAVTCSRKSSLSPSLRQSQLVPSSAPTVPSTCSYRRHYHTVCNCPHFHSWHELAGISVCELLEAGVVWFTSCSSIGVWHIRDTHSLLSENWMHNFPFLTAADSKTQVSHGQSERISLPPAWPCGGVKVLCGWGRVFMLKVVEYNPQHPS